MEEEEEEYVVDGYDDLPELPKDWNIGKYVVKVIEISGLIIYRLTLEAIKTPKIRNAIVVMIVQNAMTYKLLTGTFYFLSRRIL